MDDATTEDLKKILEASVRTCSFCGNTGRDGSAIFCTPEAAICEDCVTILGRKIKTTYGGSRIPSVMN